MFNLRSLILSLYVTAFVYANAFFVKDLMILEKVDQQFFNHLGIFLIILVPIYFLLRKLVPAQGGGGAIQFVRTILILVACLGLIASLLYHVLLIQGVYDLPGQVDQIFSSETAFTIWLIVPLLALFI